jgi:lipoate-protein ligase A
VPLIVRLISSGKTETALDGREIVEVILILKFSRQHQPQRLHKKPELRISGVKTDECMWISCSILFLRETVSMNKHRRAKNIKSFENLKSNMISNASQKVKEGKVVKVEVEYDEVIRKLKITGDFFLHPEEILEKLEKSMLGLKKDVGVDLISLKIQSIVKAHDAQMIGISPESMAMVIKEALK